MQPTAPETTTPDPTTNVRDLLRSIAVVKDSPQAFNVLEAPHDPFDLFLEWLTAAIEAGVSQPGAMTLATAGTDGRPSARTLVIKDVAEGAFWFASSSSSPKGHDLAANPQAAAVFYWREVGRQIRLSGRVEAGPRDVSDADFLQRHPNARASVFAGDQSAPLPEDAEVEQRRQEAEQRVADDPQMVASEWTAYKIIPLEIEFMQMSRSEPYTRLLYRQGPSTGLGSGTPVSGTPGSQGAVEWTHFQLWP